MIDSLANQEQLLLWAAKKYGVSVVSKMLADRYVLTTDVLEAMYIDGYSSEQILDCLKSCRYYSDAKLLFDWLCGFVGQEKTEEFIIAEFKYDPDLFQYFSSETLEKHEYWDELARRKADDILFKHEQYDKMSPEGLYKHRLFERYFKYSALIDVDDQAVLDYLVKGGRWDIIEANYGLLKNSSNLNLLNLLVKHKQYEMIAKHYPVYLTKFPEGIEYLQKNGHFYVLAENKLYDKVDWDAYLQTGAERAIYNAVIAQQWDALMRNHKHLLLLKHLKLWRFIKSFF